MSSIPLVEASKMAQFLARWRSSSKQMWRARRRALAWIYPEWPQTGGLVSKAAVKQFREDYGLEELERITKLWRESKKSNSDLVKRISLAKTREG